MQDLGTLGGDYSQAVAVTSAGAVVGTSRLATGGDRAFLWTAQSGEMRSLGSLGGGSSQATGVSDSGVVVGVSRTVTGETHAFSWTPATGMVDLGPAEGVSAAHDVNESGLAVGSAGPAGSEQATTWDTTATDAQPSAPGTARSVTASAGNGEAVVAWAPPLDNGGLDVTSYTVTAVPGGVETTVPATTDGSPNSAVVPGLTNGTAYTFTMTATNVAGTGPSSAASQPVTPRADAVAPTVVVGEATPAAGGSVTTGQATSTSQPVTASVTVPASTSGGAISIAQGSVDKTPPSGFSFFGQQVNIEAPSGTPDNRLVLTFRADDSITGGLSPEDISIFRTEGAGDPTAVPSCYAADEMPDPCVLSRTQETGYLELTVSTSAASAWNFARRAVEPYPFQGFFSPVANPPTYNKVKAGDTVPLKFSLGGPRGLFVLAAGQPVSATVPCAGTGAGTAVPTRGRLTYTSTTGRYTYQWRTERSMAGTCRRFEMTLADGSTHTALFRLTR